MPRELLELIDPDRAFELLQISGDIIEAAEVAPDESLQINVTGYRFALDAYHHARAHLRDLTAKGFDQTPHANDARRLMHQSEQLCAHFLDQLDRHLNP